MYKRMKHFIVTFFFLLTIIFTAKAQTGTWSGKLDVQGAKLTLIFHLDEENPTVDSPDQGAKGIPVQIERPVAGSIKVNVPSIGATYEGTWIGQQIVGTLKQGGASLPLTLKQGVEKLNRPQTPKEPFPYAQEAVSFTNGDAVLKGTLVLPKGYDRQTPVLVMVTGSGLQNRDEEIFEHKPFAVIADAFARAGIATLRYDDRGYGESTGELVSMTTEDIKNDALAGVKLLRERFDKVGVVGHSEGGSIALMLAADKQVDFIVSLAGMVVSGKETLLWQNRTILAALGFSQEAIDIYCKVLDEAFDARINEGQMPSADGLNLPEALKSNFTAVLAQLQTPYMQYFLALDLRSRLSEIACPVLAVNGTKDTQVDAESNLDALRKGLPQNGKNKIEAAEGLNHLFQHCKTGGTNEYKEIEETFAPEILEMMTQWILTIK